MITDTANLIVNCSDKINWSHIIDQIKDKPGKELIPNISLWD